MKVPFLDLQGQHARIRGELDAAVRAVVDDCAFIQGKPVARFEAALAKQLERRHARGVSSGTAALSIALRALGVGPGDEVITTAHTAVPTAESILLVGARPVFVDVDPETWLIDADRVEAALTPCTRALLPVHLYGMPAPLDRLLALAAQHGLPLVEDCAQAAGARLHGKRLGSFGRAGCHSFFPSKNLGGFGDGGALATDDDGIAEFAAMYRDHGRKEKFVHEIMGANERLDGLQAAVLEVKLRYLDEWNARRREVAGWYAEELAGIRSVRLQRRSAPSAEPVWHLFAVCVEDRDGLAKHLADRGVGTGIHYPLALSQQPMFARCAAPGDFPVAERVCREVLSLPMDPFLEREQVSWVCEAVKQFCVERRWT
ncbi:MAG TPA: DegT/DnrJ/EryC1/StrS family aminotransferase [Myxococcota bacterium]|nr:DegT/DnrJ/EryC1/StrS family aminotransferase [Myxococcota bacterium]